MDEIEQRLRKKEGELVKKYTSTIFEGLSFEEIISEIFYYQAMNSMLLEAIILDYNTKGSKKLNAFLADLKLSRFCMQLFMTKYGSKETYKKTRNREKGRSNGTEIGTAQN